MTMIPRVVIGLPVYNGENYLREALDSILAQTLTDFRLIIGDNASTDTTSDICREYAQKDSRIVYHRHPENIGAAPNHNFLFQPNGSPYFKWAAHDDTLEPTYLERCVAVLEQDSTLAIAHSRSLVINEHGTRVGTFDDSVRLNAPTPSARFWRLLWAGYFPEVFGLMRSDFVAKTKLQGSFAGADRNFEAEMILQGNVGYVEDYLFSRRDHPECYCRMKNQADQTQWFDPRTSRKIVKLTGLIKTKEYLSAIARLPMPMSERLACVRMLTEWTVRRGIESATGMGERFGEQFRQEFAANKTLLQSELAPMDVAFVNAPSREEATK